MSVLVNVMLDCMVTDSYKAHIHKAVFMQPV